MLLLTALALRSFVTESVALTTPEPLPVFNYPEIIPALQSHQNAWEFVTSNETLAMRYRNFNTDEQGLNNRGCVTVNKIQQDDSKHTVLHRITSYDKSAQKTFSFNKSYTVVPSTGYSTRNVMMTRILNDTFFYTFVFADKDCAVVRKHNWSNETFKACELWMFQKALKKAKPCCDFLFDLLCSREYKQIMYEPRDCEGSKTKVKHNSNNAPGNRSASVWIAIVMLLVASFRMI
uniref:Putative salivary lipocalin n=1 Tax=Ixodes ricinus TaxID=34613 RepID=A0A6B0V4Z1_IXORI